jgi:hypothetical protein
MDRSMRCRAQSFLRQTVLLALAAVLAGCASITSNDLIPQSIILPPNNHRLEGSVNVQALIYPEYSDGARHFPASPIVNAAMLKDALQKSIMKHGTFTQVSQGSADYVLDVWVEKEVNDLQYAGGGYIFDVAATWRLTRVRDGKVLVCDFVKGHGASHAFGVSAPRVSLGAATREMIQNGLAMLADQSSPHLAAMASAGFRPSMGPVVPEGLGPVVERIRQNWSKLTMGMNIAEVERLFGPIGSMSWTYTNGYTEVYSSNIYRLVFINGRLSNWALLR